jgi:DNA-binding NarL/FixJ family response regulator
MVLQGARARLVYGEWLRREDRRADARQQLRVAHETFVSVGGSAFAERARRELLATGEIVHSHALHAGDELTAQEALIAQMARDGQTNPEIGSRLFFSPRTVEYHLRKVFAKLNIASRRELRDALPDREHALAAA